MTQPNRNGDIIFEFRGKETPIKSDMPYKLLKFLLKQLKDSNNYNEGKLFIKLYEEKKEIKVKPITKYQQILNNS